MKIREARPRSKMKTIRLMSRNLPRSAAVTKFLPKKNETLLDVDNLLKYLLDQVELLTESMNQTKKHKFNKWYNDSSSSEDSSQEKRGKPRKKTHAIH